MPYSQRKKILKSIKYVDEVIRCVDSDRTVTRTLQRLKPDVFAKGGDRTKENIPKAEVEACRKLGIELIVGVGGGKIQSSSWLVKKLDESMKASKKRE